MSRAVDKMRVGVSREAERVVLDVRSSSGDAFTANLHRRGAATVAAQLSAAATAEADLELECELRGELELQPGEPHP